MSASPYKQLEQEFKRLHAFRGALALLRWDAAVMMPRGSADVRGEQLAALETEHHALLTAPRIIRLLDRAQANTQGLEDWQIANLHEMRRQRDHAIATPATLVSRLTKAASRAESRWLEARVQGKFEAFAPYLEEVVHLVRDSRGVAYSWTKKVARPDAPGREMYMHRFQPPRIAFRWTTPCSRRCRGGSPRSSAR